MRVPIQAHRSLEWGCSQSQPHTGSVFRCCFLVRPCGQHPLVRPAPGTFLLTTISRKTTIRVLQPSFTGDSPYQFKIHANN